MSRMGIQLRKRNGDPEWVQEVLVSGDQSTYYVYFSYPAITTGGTAIHLTSGPTRRSAIDNAAKWRERHVALSVSARMTS